MKIDLDKIISECINHVLYEDTINTKSDNVIYQAQKKISDHLKNKLNNGDEEFLNILKKKGFSNTLSKKEILNNVERLFKNNEVSDEIKNDILRVAKILKPYVGTLGGFNEKQLMKDYPSDYDEIIKIKNFIDIKGLTRLYDKSANRPTKNYGINWNDENSIENDLNFNEYSDSEVKDFRKEKEETLDYTRIQMKKSIVDKYLQFKYGLKLNIPNITFSNGNSKLPKTTLIINFSSALNCPAWNECIVKHACYARATEKGKSSVYNANENRSLYWLTTQNDPELMKLMMDFVRSYCFKYNKIHDELLKKNMIKHNMTAIKLSTLPLDDPFFTPEIIEIMKKHKRMENIRLNENGDFVGQWLVDAWDNEAGLYIPYGINVSAYTCRHLNYNGIKNIILNTSFSNKEGNVARNFIAIPKDIYDALDETYNGPNNSLVFGQESVEPNPQPLYNPQNGTPNGSFYYKCPCGRTKNNEKNKIGCYQCNLCYSPKSSQNKMYVFVEAHGSGKDCLNGYDLIENNIGVSKNFMKNYAPVMKENNNMGNRMNIAKSNGIKKVVNNTITSVYEHFQNLGTSNRINEAKDIKLYNINWLDD